MISISIDVDWAPEAVIYDTMELLDQYGAKATFFCTHESRNLLDNRRDAFELGIHPNFNSLLSGKAYASSSASKIMDELLLTFSDAKGVRSHSCTVSSQLLDLFYNRGLVYDANIFLPYQAVEGFRMWNDFVRIPYCWEDDVHFLFDKDFSDLGVEMTKDDLVVLDFHPIHIFLNTSCEQDYLKAKTYYQNPKKLLEVRNSKRLGTRDAFISILQKVAQNGLETRTLYQVAQTILKAKNSE